jgi:transcriptional antiterminator NusG
MPESEQENRNPVTEEPEAREEQAPEPVAEEGTDEAVTETAAPSAPEGEAEVEGEAQAEAEAEQQEGGPEEEVEGEAGAAEEAGEEGAEEEAEEPKMRWYVLRVATNREEQVRDGLQRKVKIEGLEGRLGRIIVPTERVPRPRTKPSDKKFTERKLYPGYVFVEMMPEPDGSIPDDVWFVVKETTGVGDFIGSEGKPTEMSAHEVERMLAESEKPAETPSLRVSFKKGDRVKIKEGPFENFEGEVELIDSEKGVVRVIVPIFSRPTPLDIEYWMLEPV